MPRKVKGKNCLFTIDAAEHGSDKYVAHVFMGKESMGYVDESSISDLLTGCCLLVCGEEKLIEDEPIESEEMDTEEKDAEENSEGDSE